MDFKSIALTTRPSQLLYCPRISYINTYSIEHHHNINPTNLLPCICWSSIQNVYIAKAIDLQYNTIQYNTIPCPALRRRPVVGKVGFIDMKFSLLMAIGFTAWFCRDMKVALFIFNCYVCSHKNGLNTLLKINLWNGVNRSVFDFANPILYFSNNSLFDNVSSNIPGYKGYKSKCLKTFSLCKEHAKLRYVFVIKQVEWLSANHYFTSNSQIKDIAITFFVNNKSFANIWWWKTLIFPISGHEFIKMELATISN